YDSRHTPPSCLFLADQKRILQFQQWSSNTKSGHWDHSMKHSRINHRYSAVLNEANSLGIPQTRFLWKRPNLHQMTEKIHNVYSAQNYLNQSMKNWLLHNTCHHIHSLPFRLYCADDTV